MISKGLTGGLVIFDDRPNYWDAWGSSWISSHLSHFHNVSSLDVEIHHLETAELIKFENISVVAEGPLRASLKAETKYGDSKISVVVCEIILWFLL